MEAQSGTDSSGCAGAEADSTTCESRRYGRIRCNALRCSNGYVVDLSASGARLQWMRSLRQKPGDVMQVSIEVPHNSLTLQCRVVWSKRLGWRRHQVGVEFLDVSEDQRLLLSTLVRQLVQHIGEPFRGVADRYCR